MAEWEVDNAPDDDVGVATETQKQVKKPPLYSPYAIRAIGFASAAN